MDYQDFLLFQPYSLLLLLLVFLSSTYFLLKRHLVTKSLPKNLPPGSLGWPLIGETFEFLSGNPEDFIQQRLEKYATQVFKTNILGERTIFFSGPAASKLIANNELKLVKLWLPHSQKRLFAIDYTKSHQKSLHLMRPPPGATGTGFTRLYGFLKPEAKFVEKFDSMMRWELREHWEGHEGEVVRAYGLVKSFVLTLSCNNLLGMEPERSKKLTGKLDVIVNGLQSIHVNFPGTVYHRAKKAVAELGREIQLLITERTAEDPVPATEDFLSLLIAGNVDQSGKVILRSTVANIATGVMAASYGSVVTTITHMIKFVGLRPDVYDKIYSEQSEILTSKGGDALNWDHINRMKYTWAVACETMRIVTPFIGTFREVLTDFNFAGYAIPKGWKIFWAVNTSNKNPEYFPEPEKFDPSRFMENEQLPYTFQPFGGGPRMCAGKEWARLAILIFMHNLVTKFKWEIINPNEKVLNGMVMPAPVEGLPIRLHTLSSFVSPN
ncbi:Cytochrome P450, E-class, group I [Parasponia andersonii]|uniref:Cytochrome P450, E-class, group I n=1 Tax=Parasponia andersonii TaxID=3476 RepID=A0A2P5CRN7_PARAD|nr:Cytochrome P450, E-class, group I [Parasponia andersonii]